MYINRITHCVVFCDWSLSFHSVLKREVIIIIIIIMTDLHCYLAENWKHQSLSHVQLFATPWTVAHHAPLPMGFLREYWSWLPFPLPEIQPVSPTAPALVGRFLTTEPPGKPQCLGNSSVFLGLSSTTARNWKTTAVGTLLKDSTSLQSGQVLSCNSPECWNFTVRKMSLDAAVSEELVELKERATFPRSESITPWHWRVPISQWLNCPIYLFIFLSVKW